MSSSIAQVDFDHINCKHSAGINENQLALIIYLMKKQFVTILFGLMSIHMF